MKTVISLGIALILLSACSDNSSKEAKKLYSSYNNQSVTTNKDTKPNTLKQAQTTSKSIVHMKIGATIFITKCASCHGKEGKKSALNSSAIIAGWSSDKIKKALHGYKNRTYGGKLKAVMQGQTAPLSDEDINKVAIFVSTL